MVGREFVGIEVEGLDEIRRKLSGRPAYVDPVKKALLESALVAESDVKEHAPVDSGRLRASVTHRLEARELPRFAEVGTNVRYAIYLDRPKTRTPHYRRGPRRGQETAGWLSGVLERKAAEIRRFLEEAARKIEKIWSS